MNFYLVIAFGLSIIFPAIIGLIRYAKINEAYHPFIYYIWIGSINEIFGLIMMYTIKTNIVNLNIYLLAESLLLLWQFKRWRLFSNNSIWLKFIIASLVLVWVTENFIISSITKYDSYFCIYNETINTFMSISIINRLIATERKSLWRNPVFIICSTFVIYYSMSILTEVFWIYGLSLNEALSKNINAISISTNFISIILYTLAIIWMPIKQRFSLPAS